MARGYRKAWAKLRVAGIRTSKERVRRVMREHDLQAPQRAGHAHGPKAHDGTITTEAPDVMWGTDMTATVTGAEGAAFVFVAVDHCATECIGLHAAKRGNRFEALEPIRQGIRERFGGISEGVAQGLRLRHDHGSNYLADDFQQEVAFFGIESSPSFVAGADGHRQNLDTVSRAHAGMHPARSSKTCSKCGFPPRTRGCTTGRQVRYSSSLTGLGHEGKDHMAFKWIGGGGKAQRQVEDLHKLIETAREERGALSAMLTQVSTRSSKLGQVGKVARGGRPEGEFDRQAAR